MHQSLLPPPPRNIPSQRIYITPPVLEPVNILAHHIFHVVSIASIFLMHALAGGLGSGAMATFNEASMSRRVDQWNNTGRVWNQLASWLSRRISVSDETHIRRIGTRQIRTTEVSKTGCLDLDPAAHAARHVQPAWPRDCYNGYYITPCAAETPVNGLANSCLTLFDTSRYGLLFRMSSRKSGSAHLSHL